MEFAYELVKGYKADNARVRRLMKSTRVIVMPIVNPEGFNTSREAGAGRWAWPAGAPGNDTVETATCRVPVRVPAQELPREQHGPGGPGPRARQLHPAAGHRPGAVRRRPQPQLRRLLGRPRRGGQRRGAPGRRLRAGLPRRRPVLRARDAEHPRSGLQPPGHHADHQPHLLQPGAAPAGHPGAGPVRRTSGIYKALGDSMAANNGYASQTSYLLYDTTGGTEDWTYYATGGLGFTFEIGLNGFHPPYAETIAEYEGTPRRAGPARAATARRTSRRSRTPPTHPSTRRSPARRPPAPSCG